MELQTKLTIFQILIAIYAVFFLTRIKSEQNVLANWTEREIAILSLGHHALQFVIWIIIGKYAQQLYTYTAVLIFIFILIYNGYLSSIANAFLAYRVNIYSTFDKTILIFLSRLHFITTAILILIALTIGTNL